ncbi:hypothetical protein AB0O72_33865, partial [Streptomyces sp. NPDC088106]
MTTPGELRHLRELQDPNRRGGAAVRAISGLGLRRRNPLCSRTGLAGTRETRAVPLVAVLTAPATGRPAGPTAREAVRWSVRAGQRARHPVAARGV